MLRMLSLGEIGLTCVEVAVLTVSGGVMVRTKFVGEGVSAARLPLPTVGIDAPEIWEDQYGLIQGFEEESPKAKSLLSSILDCPRLELLLPSAQGCSNLESLLSLTLGCSRLKLLPESIWDRAGLEALSASAGGSPMPGSVAGRRFDLHN